MGATSSKQRIQPMDYPDLLFLRWAEGWLDLGSAREAQRQLEEISGERRSHPDVLLLRWQIQAQEQNWSECMLLALAWTERLPNDSRAWIALARTLYHKNRIAEAYEIGIGKASEFAGSWELLYDTARYACLLGKRKEANQFLRLAMAAGDENEVKVRALEDPDLQGLWKCK
jgi:predicted Zn-dependent protease